MDFPLQITAWTVLILGMIYVGQTFSVIAYRRSNRIVLGDNDDRVMRKRIRGHGNMAEQLPLAIMVLALVEWLLPGWAAIALAVLFILGRAIHAAYFAIDGVHWSWRQVGMVLTLTGQIAGLIALLIGLIT